jgi:hypothetical protein
MIQPEDLNSVSHSRWASKILAKNRARLFPFILLLLIMSANFSPLIQAKRDSVLTGVITVHLNPAHPANTFIPWQALGAGIDGHERGDITKMLSSENVREMLSAGFKPLTYRLRTELGSETWHWNPQGKWSDAKHQQGYWISATDTDKPISVCYGYRLPRRGNTIDQANNDGYSRLDDGNVNTYWKSNPYLDQHFTGENNAAHPQWVVIDLGEEKNVNAISLLWGKPYATNYTIDYATGKEVGGEEGFVATNPKGLWHRFPKGEIIKGQGGKTFIRLSDKPISARCVRVWMTESSHTAIRDEKDVRDKLGYALREIYVGFVDQTGRFQDFVTHAKDNQNQSEITVSSTDSWHRAVDIDWRTEQPGFDKVFKSGLTNNLPMLAPVALLYDTPENAIAEIQFLKSHGYKIEELEMGEEPEGQFIAPKDYGALYKQWAKALHTVDAQLKLGGPCFASIDTELSDNAEILDSTIWLKQFLEYLREANQLEDFSFLSFEWYPFDDVCAATAPQLARAPEMLTKAMKLIDEAGVPRSIPRYITEYGYSAYAGEAEVNLAGALLNADTVGQFLTLGGSRAYLYGYEANEVIQELPCSWGINAMFLRGKSGRIQYRLATYYGARLLTQEWAQPVAAVHKIYLASSNIKNQDGQALVTAYAVQRPDGQFALMLINKDPQQAYTVRINFFDETQNATLTFRSPTELFQFSAQQYVWQADQASGYPLKSLPPKHSTLNENNEQSILLPASSLSVLRGQVATQK